MQKEFAEIKLEQNSIILRVKIFIWSNEYFKKDK